MLTSQLPFSRCVASLLIALLPLQPAPAIAVSFPSGASIGTIADALEINGTTGSIQRFVVRSGMPDVAEHFRKSFNGKQTESELSGYKVMAAMEGDQFQTVRFREIAPGIVEGFLLSTALRELRQGPKWHVTPTWLPPLSIVISDVGSLDDGQRSTTTVAMTRSGLDGAREHLRRVLTAQGYRLDRESSNPETGDSILWFAGSHDDISISLARLQDHTSLVIHRAKGSRPLREGRP